MAVDTYGPGIAIPISGQPISSDLYGIPMRAAVVDLDQRVQAFGLVLPPIVTATNGNATSSTTDTIDTTGVGTYQFQASDGIRYRVVLSGREVNSTVAGDRFQFAIRNGGTSTPTTASPAVATATGIAQAASTAGRASVHVTGTFVPGAGTVTLAVFMQRLNGTGLGTPTGLCEFYVEAIGTV